MIQKHFIFTISFILALAIFASCEKEDDESLFEEKQNVAATPSEGSSKSAEEQKGVMESTGITLNDELTSISKSESMEASVSFAYHLTHMDEDPLKSNYKAFQKTEAFNIIQAINELDNDEKSVTDFMAELKQNDWEPESATEIYDSLSGKYTWDTDKESWTVTENEKIIFEFPSKKGGDSNDAVFVVESVSETKLDDYYYFGEGSWNEEPEESYKGYVPTGLHFYLEVGEDKSMEYKYTASFNGEGFLKEASVDFSLGSLSYLTEFKNNNSQEISSTTTLKNGEKKLIEFGAGIQGDISQDNIENSIQYRAYNEETYRDTIISAEDTSKYDYYYPEPDPKELLNEGFAYFSILDKIKLGGKVAIKDLIKAEEDIYPLNYWDNPDFDSNQATNDWAAALNEHTDLFVANMEENKWMAKANFYVKEETDYNETYSYVALHFKFSDESKVDPETYFGEGFDDLIKNFNTSMKEVESAYSSYDL